MNDLLLEKLDEMFNELNNCNEIEQILDLKQKIYNDKELSILLKKYREIDKYDPNIVNLKKEIISNPLIEKYHKLENKLYFIVLESNKKLNTLIDKKGC